MSWYCKPDSGGQGIILSATEPRAIGVTYNAKDAPLAAAAPELLAALEALVEWGRTHTSPTDKNSPHELLIAGHEAAWKARGHI